MTNPQTNPSEALLIDLAPGRNGPSVSPQAAAENCRYMKRKLGAMPFLIPSLTRDSSVLHVDCRSLYGKSWQGRMISSPHTLSRLLLEEFGLAVAPEGGASDAFQLSGAVSEENMHAGLSRLERLMSDIIQ